MGIIFPYFLLTTSESVFPGNAFELAPSGDPSFTIITVHLQEFRKKLTFKGSFHK